MIENKRADLERLCQRFHARWLELFGSAAGEGFDPTRGDLDFLVEFHELPTAIRSPDFPEEIASSRRLLYAA